jgi:cell division protein FtsB
MHTGHALNHGSRPGNADPPPVREEDFRSTADLIAETRADLRRTMEEVDAQRDDYEWHERKTRILSVISVILIALFGVAVWFTYPTWRGQKAAIADILDFQSRVSGLESTQRESSERVNQLQEQVTGLQREIAAIREEGSAARGKTKGLNDAEQTRSRESSGPKEPVVTNQTAANTSDNRVDRKRIDFEVSSDQAKEVAPNLYITVSRADAGKQEIDATLKLGEDAGYVTVRGQGIRKPVLLHIPGESRPIELVFTQISRNGASGYLMMSRPRTNGSK